MIKIKKADSRKILVFVYGSLKKGHGNNRLLKNADFLGEVETVEKFEMKNGGGFPFVSRNAEVSTIKGELYAVHPLELERLDQLEGYRPNSTYSFYTREKIEVKLNGQVLKANIYLCSNGNGTVNLEGKWTGKERMSSYSFSR